MGKDIKIDKNISFSKDDLDNPISMHEYLQSNVINEDARIKTRIKEAVIEAIMYLILVIGLFSILGYTRHVDFIAQQATIEIAQQAKDISQQAKDISQQAKDISLLHNTRNTQIAANETLVCKAISVITHSQQAIIVVLIDDPIFNSHNLNRTVFANRLQKLQKLQINANHAFLPRCGKFLN